MGVEAARKACHTHCYVDINKGLYQESSFFKKLGREKAARYISGLKYLRPDGIRPFIFPRGLTSSDRKL